MTSEDLTWSPVHLGSELAKRGLERSEEFWELAVATNAAFKGLLGYFGQSGHVCERTIPVAGRLKPERGPERLLDDCAAMLGASSELQRGDVVVVAEKIWAVAQRRIVTIDAFGGADPKRLAYGDRVDLAARLSAQLHMDIDEADLVRADWFSEGDRQCMTLGAKGHNEIAAELASNIARRTGLVVDVVVSDTDTGLDVRRPLIGTLTIGATPLGATAGLNLYECMRCAVAAEFERGHDRVVPMVICRPARRCQERAECGRPRGYPGTLDIEQEGQLTDG